MCVKNDPKLMPSFTVSFPDTEKLKTQYVSAKSSQQASNRLLYKFLHKINVSL